MGKWVGVPVMRQQTRTTKTSDAHGWMTDGKAKESTDDDNNDNKTYFAHHQTDKATQCVVVVRY